MEKNDETGKHYLKDTDLKPWRDAGFKLTPLVGPFDENYPPEQRGKRPIELNWRQKGYSKSLITVARFKYMNGGWIIPENYVAVDVDPRNFPEGQDSLANLQQDLGINLVKSCAMISHTGGGGMHLIFKKPRATKLVNELKDYPGIEFKSAGRQIVIAGSMHPSGKLYEWDEFNSGFENVTQLPDPLLKLASRKQMDLSNVRVDPNKLKNTASAIQRGREMLSEIIGPAIEGAGGDNQTYRAACTLRDYGLTPEKALELLLEWNESCVPPWDIEDLQTKIDNAYNYAQNTMGAATAMADFDDDPTSADDNTTSELTAEEAAEQEAELIQWRNGLQLNRYGVIKPNFHNTAIHIKYEDKLAGLIAYNDFANDVVFLKPAPWHSKEDMELWPRIGGKPWSDHDDIHAKAYFNRMDFDPEVKTIKQAVIEASKAHRFHPIRDLYNSFKWDGVPRLGTWISKYCGATDNAYTREVAEIVLVAGCARIFQPGIKFECVPILEGAQGTGKSTAWRILALEDCLFTDAVPDFASKDFPLSLRNKTIYEFAEMASFSKTDVNRVKAMLSHNSDYYRPPYGSRMMDVPRQIIFVGTTNHATFIDETGNRRFWPIKTKQIDMDGLRKVAPQLWAEAMHIYRRSDKNLFLDLQHPEAREIALSEQSERYMSDDWAEIVFAWIDKGGSDLTDAEPLTQVTGLDIWTECLGRSSSHFDRKAQYRISDLMRAGGWGRGSFRNKDGRVIKGYVKED